MTRVVLNENYFNSLPLWAGSSVRCGPARYVQVHGGKYQQKTESAEVAIQHTIDRRFSSAYAVLPPYNIPNTPMQAAPAQQAPLSTQVLIWRCKHPHGIFSCFCVAMGHAQSCYEKQGWALYIDWSSPEMVYRGPQGEPNLWEAFFYQPAKLDLGDEGLRQVLSNRQYVETSELGNPFGDGRGSIQNDGTIPLDLAASGRALCRRMIRLKDEFENKLAQASERFLGGNYCWLAVHIRRGDKACEASANFTLSDEAIAMRIFSQCVAWRCDAVFLCSDDVFLKQRLTDILSAPSASEGSGLKVSTYPSTLSTVAGQATHFDKSLDSYKKAEDVMMEAFLMARYCHGLLSTFSNVSASVVYLSPDDYPYTTFWDPVDASHCHWTSSLCTWLSS